MLDITRTSTLTGTTRTLSLDVTPAQVALYQQGGTLIQDAFPQLTMAEREFIKTGITAQEWDEMFGIEA
jgi:hypothetical protein